MVVCGNDDPRVGVQWDENVIWRAGGGDSGWLAVSRGGGMSVGEAEE